jgi:phosphatidylserine/phosphatidylglycerophosphate/cardiolipin synthase-like enzyme
VRHAALSRRSDDQLTEAAGSCHVKFMSVDSQVAILGNGNQDTQSWCHSQEVNIMVDSPQLVQDWEAMLTANQNTGRFGRTEIDGIWRDRKGRTVEELDQLELKTPEAKKVAAKAARHSV